MNPSIRARSRRAGTIAPLTALLIFPVFLLMLAFAVDMGNISFTQAQLQRAADGAALAGAAELIKHPPSSASPNDYSSAVAYATAEAERVARQMSAGNVSSLSVPDTDVSVGFLDSSNNFTVYPGAVTVNGVVYNPPFPNSVVVTTRRQSGTNGEQPTYFAGFFGKSSWSLSATARGTTISASSFNYSAGASLLLPFAVPKTTSQSGTSSGNSSGLQVGWDDLQTLWSGGKSFTNSAGITIPYSDTKSVGTTLNAPSTGTPYGAYSVSSGSDGIPEVSIYGDGSTTSGNFGLVSLNIPGSNATGSFDNWILNGPSAADLSGSGGGSPLPFPTSGNSVSWDGGPGFHDAINTDANIIIGEARLVPIYTATGGGNGNNTTYTISGFGAVIVTGWTGQGNNATMTIQPTTLIDPSLAGTTYSGPSAPGSTNTNSTIFAAPCLTQ